MQIWNYESGHAWATPRIPLSNEPPRIYFSMGIRNEKKQRILFYKKILGVPKFDATDKCENFVAQIKKNCWETMFKCCKVIFQLDKSKIEY